MPVPLRNPPLPPTALSQRAPAMPASKVPQPGPAKLTKNSGPDEWLKCALNNQYLPEAIMKKLCEICKELLMEGGCSKRLLSPFHHLQCTKRSITTPCDLTSISRIEYPASFYTCHHLRRSSRPILRRPRTVPRRWWRSKRREARIVLHSHRCYHLR